MSAGVPLVEPGAPGFPRPWLGIALLRWFTTLPERYGRPRTSFAYIPQIDGLRALAIAAVIFWHAGLRVVRQVDDLNRSGLTLTNYYDWLPHGEIGVALFFVVSGFVIAQPFLSRPQAEWRIGRFYWRRMHRIYPPFFIVLVLGLITLRFAGGQDLHLHSKSTVPLAQSFVASALYLHGLIFDSSSRIDPPIWSLEVEIQFYAISPFLLWAYVAIRDRKTRILAGSAFALVMILAAGIIHGIVPFDGRFRFGLPAHLHLFIVGFILADAAKASDPLKRRATFGFDIAFAAGLLALTAIGLYLTRVDASPPGGMIYIATQLGLTLSAIGIYFGAMLGRIGRSVMSQSWICLTGTACYSIYLLHVGIIQLVDAKLLRHLRLHSLTELWMIGLPVLCLASWAVGLAYYTTVERRFMNRTIR